MNEDILQDLLEGVRGPLWGKYRGTVTEVDAATMRVKAKVPGALPGGVPSGWCEPCVPYAGKKVGVVMLPDVGSGVWIEFERGEASRPIWVGCFWNKGDVPDSARADVKSIITSAGILAFDDGASSVTLQETNQDSLSLDASGATMSAGALSLDASGATLSAGASKVELGASGVSINDGALEVT
jgi:phage baseplate assembly protein gpV